MRHTYRTSKSQRDEAQRRNWTFYEAIPFDDPAKNPKRSLNPSMNERLMQLQRIYRLFDGFIQPIPWPVKKDARHAAPEMW